MYKIELSEAHLQIVAEALGNTPMRIALPVFNEINKQLADQKKEENA